MSREIYCRAVLDSSGIRVKADLGQTVVEYVGESTLGEHSIHFALADGTGIDIPVFYDDAAISAAVTAFVPAAYDGKTVVSAALDGVIWYTRPTEIWETLLDRGADVFGEEGEDGYLWIAELGDISIEEGQVWRITWNGTEYRYTAYFSSQYSTNVLGGDDTPFLFYNPGWGAWVCDTHLFPGTHIQLKIEYLTAQ